MPISTLASSSEPAGICRIASGVRAWETRRGSRGCEQSLLSRPRIEPAFLECRRDSLDLRTHERGVLWLAGCLGLSGLLVVRSGGRPEPVMNRVLLGSHHVTTLGRRRCVRCHALGSHCRRKVLAPLAQRRLLDVQPLAWLELVLGLDDKVDVRMA